VNPFDSATVLEVLRDGELEVLGRLVASTNHAMYSRVTRICPDPEPPVVLDAVYKPVRGERPLDDFPDGTLARREVAAHAVSQATGWAIVPPTVMRDGPFGEGMVQLWIDVDDSVDVVAMVVEDDPRLRRVALFDAVVNNTDRKGGHLLPVPGGHVFGVDHGVCFSPVPKLRTVLWGWRGEPLAEDELAVLAGIRGELDGGLGDELRGLLQPVEVAATIRRTDRLLASRRFPWPSPGWPAVPWPPF
jgi:hypothetical protein